MNQRELKNYSYFCPHENKETSHIFFIVHKREDCGYLRLEHTLTALSGIYRLLIFTIMEENTSLVPKPDSHLGLAIFTTLCCCLPLGIMAILKAIKVGDYYTMKQYEAANQASAEAKKWCIYGIASMFVVDVVWIIICLISGASFFAFLPFL